MSRSLLLTILIFTLALSTFAQSGRAKKKHEKKLKKKSRNTANYVLTQKAGKRTAAKLSSKPSSVHSGKDSDMIYVDSALVPIPVLVIDSLSGKAVKNLNLKDFELKIDDKIVEISDFFRFKNPVRLALLFDNSSSAIVAREFEQKAAIRFFKQVLRPDKDLAALYSVAETAQLERPLTNDVSSLIRAVKSLAMPKGATALHDGVIKASSYLQNYSGRRVIVIISDGQDTLSNSTFDEVIKTVQKNNCQVYIVHTNEFENYKRTGSRRGNANSRGLTAERRMKSLADQTGGAVYSPIDERELNQAFTRISAELSQQYILAYYPENEIRDGKFRTIDLRIKSDRRSLTVRARKGYYVSKAN